MRDETNRTISALLSRRARFFLAIPVAFSMPVHALTILGSSASSQNLSTDTSYLINAGTSITTSYENAINVEGIAPVTITNAGSITSAPDSVAAGVRFDVPGSLNPATARGTANGASAGLYATWRGNAYSADGPYVDTWFPYAHFDNSVKGAELAGENYGSNVWSGSVEGGWAFALGSTSTGPVLLEPELQFIYSNYHADDHSENNGTVVRSDNGGGLTTRVGARLFHASASPASPGWLPFVEVNWWHDTRVASVSFNDVSVSQDGPHNRVELKIGAQGQIAPQ